MMKNLGNRNTMLALAALLPAACAYAQLGGVLGQAGKEAGRITGQGLTSSSLGNVTGLLQYCVTNNYLGGEGINAVQDKLTNKLPGGSSSKDPGYNDGLKGVLHASNGNRMDLGGSAQDEIKRQVCNTILAQAKTML
jgi:Protein of unknown function (DUF2501)